MDAVQLGVKYYPSRIGGEVPDGLHPQEGLCYITECGVLGPQAQHQPLHGPRLPPHCDPAGAPILPWVTYKYPTLSPQVSVPRGHYIHHSQAGVAQDTGAQASALLLDLRGDLESHRGQGTYLEIPVQVPMVPLRPKFDKCGHS